MEFTSQTNPSSADPLMVHQLTEAIEHALEQTSISQVTTAADILSALFTSLDHVLAATRAVSRPEDSANNTAEINRVLLNFLMEYGNIKTN